MTTQTTHLKQDEQVTICGNWWRKFDLELVELLEDATCDACIKLASPHMRAHPEHDGELNKPEDIKSLERLIFDYSNPKDLVGRLRMLVACLRDGARKEAHPKAYYTDIIERIFAEAGYIKPDEIAAHTAKEVAAARIDELENLDSLTHSFMSLGNDFVYEYRQSAVNARIAQLQANNKGELENE